MGPIIWLIAAAVLAVGEFLIMDFTLLMLAVAALTTAGVSAIDIPVWAEVGVFGVTSAASLLLLRPVLRRRYIAQGEVREFTSKELEGQSAEVLSEVTSDNSAGQVSIAGDIWSARAAHPGTSFAEGDRVQVVSIEGTTAVVWKGV
ncbi:NfeD family protein [Corynebacterium glyciniphilum]|uniref:NfeD family protein n=1 Tax=Corynebacterium glyciniphilum TaxID=1404244 RepID=UPI0011AB2EE2|nr:NfeD family protein [Corynebacterium glyciniphilum]MDN5684108.1 NfeD family protein [Corynebacterium glyciniphilum]MDN6704794.1 NfeD family protein [Corynebacterium glyciniphilum]